MKKTEAKEIITLFFQFVFIGTFTIGGGFAMIPLLERIAVEKRKWFTPDEMMECITISQSMPGVIATNLATYVGYKKHGIKGAFAATIGVVLPSFVIIMVLAQVLDLVIDNRYVQGAFMGVKTGLCGLIVATTYRMAKYNLKTFFAWVMAMASFVLIAFFEINGVFIVVGAALIGLAVKLIASRKNTEKEEK